MTKRQKENRSLVFHIDEKLLQRRPPRLTLAGTLAALGKRIQSEELEANFIIDILNENHLLPYMLTHNKNILDVTLGRTTNASKIGDLIVSEECIRGTYELCIAFLEFVLATISDSEYKDTTKTILASVIYISNEIYPSHHIWTYRNIKEMDRILSLCTHIFHHIISNIKQPALDERIYTELEIVCIFSLSQNQAHRQLLDVIVEGKKKTELSVEQNTSTLSSVRQSLFIFNKLLSHSTNIKTYCDSETLKDALKNTSPSTYQHGASSSNSPSTSIERALFDTNIRPGLLQHLFSFIYQKNDSTTACLAVDLIKNIATKFSMSLMACLGSEADKVCEFFVDCLGAAEPNIDLEVAILDLLSTCVKHQPGLIELFLNFKKESKEKVQTPTSSLEVVMNLLKECKAHQENSYKKLHTYLMKFILTFWEKHHSAIEQFDKAENFWEHVTYPLFQFLDARDSTKEQSNNITTHAADDKLKSYALMILAREIFCLNVEILDRKMNSNLTKLLDDMKTRNLLGKYSTYVRKKYSSISEDLDDKSKDYNRLLMAWRDFLISYAKYKPFEITKNVQNQIVEDILVNMTVEIKLGEKLDKERMSAVGEALLLIWNKWMEKNSSGDSVFKSIHELLYLADGLKEYLPFSFLLTFQSTVNLYLMRNREYLTESSKSFDLLPPSFQLMQFSLKIIEKNLNEQPKMIALDYKPGVESRLCLASIMTTRFIIDVSRRDVSLWFSYVQTNLKTDVMVQFLSYLMSKRVGSEICLSVVELLLSLSSIRETAHYLNKSGLINQVNMLAVSAYERPYAHLSQLAPVIHITSNESRIKEDISKKNSNCTPMDTVGIINDRAKIYLDSLNSDHKWLPVYWHIIKLNISMILTLSKDYIATAVEYLSIHCIRICEIFELLRTRPRSVNMEEALQMIYMITLVLRHGSMWKRRNRQSHDAISEEIAKTAYTLATSALPPPTSGEQHTSINPRDCLVYARCCYDFGKYTEAERVLFQTKFGDKDGFIKEAGAIYSEQLSKYAFHLAALICLKTNRQLDSIDFALQVFADDPEQLDIVTALSQDRI